MMISSLHRSALRRPVTVQVPVNGATLAARIRMRPGARGVVIIPCADGSRIHERGNEVLATRLTEAGFATLLVDLLTATEAVEDAETSALRFNQRLVVSRLVGVTRWVGRDLRFADLPIAYLASGLGVGAALAAARVFPMVKAVVGRGARLDGADSLLHRVTANVLLFAGERDIAHLRDMREALPQLPHGARVDVVSGAGHLLDDPRSLDYMAESAAEWLLGSFLAEEAVGESSAGQFADSPTTVCSLV